MNRTLLVYMVLFLKSVIKPVNKFANFQLELTRTMRNH